jgi:hypothetical protein
MTALQMLIGLLVQRIEVVQDYVQILFSDGTMLTIYNNYRYDGTSIQVINGTKVISIAESDERVAITFDDPLSLSVSLSPGDYNGPEAMVLRRKVEATVVWH